MFSLFASDERVRKCTVANAEAHDTNHFEDLLETRPTPRASSWNIRAKFN